MKQVTSSSILSRRDHRPSFENLNDNVVKEVATKWKDLGGKLLGDDSQKDLDIIAEDNRKDTVGCCKAVFTKWLDTQYDASWNQLLDALKSPSVQMDTLASRIEKLLDDATESNHQRLEQQEPYQQSVHKSKVSTKACTTQFCTLLTKVAQVLDKKCGDKLEVCKEFCSSLKISDDSDELLFNDKQLEQIDWCKTFRDFFTQLRQHWSWDEYSILQHIIELAESEQSEKELTKYKEFMAAKIGMKIIFDILPELPHDAIKLSITVDKPYSRLTVQEYKELKVFIFDTLQVQKYVSYPFIKVLFSSVHLDWYFPVQAADHMIKIASVKRDVLVQESIVFMKIKDKVIVNCKDEIMSLVDCGNELSPVMVWSSNPSSKVEKWLPLGTGDQQQTRNCDQETRTGNQDKKAARINDQESIRTGDQKEEQARTTNQEELIRTGNQEENPTRISILEEAIKTIGQDEEPSSIFTDQEALRTGNQEVPARPTDQVELIRSGNEEEEPDRISDQEEQCITGEHEEEQARTGSIKQFLNKLQHPVPNIQKLHIQQMFAGFLEVYYKHNKHPCGKHMAGILHNIVFILFFLMSFLFPITVYATTQEQYITLGYCIMFVIASTVGLTSELWKVIIPSCDYIKRRYMIHKHSYHLNVSVDVADENTDLLDISPRNINISTVLKTFFNSDFLIYPSIISSLYGFINGWKFHGAIVVVSFIQLLLSLVMDIIYIKISYIWLCQKIVRSSYKAYNKLGFQRFEGYIIYFSPFSLTIAYMIILMLTQWFMIALIGIRIYADNLTAERNSSVNSSNKTEYQHQESSSYTAYMIWCGWLLPVLSTIVYIVVNKYWFFQIFWSIKSKAEVKISNTEKLLSYLVDPAAHIGVLVVMSLFIAFVVGSFLPDHDHNSLPSSATAARNSLVACFILLYLLSNIQTTILFLPAFFIALLLIILLAVFLVPALIFALIVFCIIFLCYSINTHNITPNSVNRQFSK